MDDTQRKMTKIAREVGKFTVQMMKEEGIGTAEFDVIHFVRHHPGATQTSMRETLKIDKGAAAKRVASLEHKGYLIRKPNPEDGRSQLLYATEKAEELKKKLDGFLRVAAGGTAGEGKSGVLQNARCAVLAFQKGKAGRV